MQGMNVLAAPFLYTMPSELEAFFCFAKFIEEVRPTYVQPTLEGIHHGLKVRSMPVMPSRYQLNICIVTRPVSEDLGPRAVPVPTLEEPLRRTLRFPMCVPRLIPHML